MLERNAGSRDHGHVGNRNSQSRRPVRMAAKGRIPTYHLRIPRLRQDYRSLDLLRDRRDEVIRLDLPKKSGREEKVLNGLLKHDGGQVSQS
jgi:hypothetical protein